MKKQNHDEYEKLEIDKYWKMRLFVTDTDPLCICAFRNLKKICEEHLGGKYSIEVIDIFEKPKLARKEQIVAIPTLMKLLPEPKRLLIGDFSRTESVLRGLDIELQMQG